VKSRDEHLSEAKQRALIRVSMGAFTQAVKGLRADLAKHPVTAGVVPDEQALRGFREQPWTRRSVGVRKR
jgi:hypothetical protein